MRTQGSEHARARSEKRLLNICFHGVGRPGRALEDGEATYWITRDHFLRVLDDVVDLPHVRLSFDDGNDSDHSIALGALRDRGLRATFFVLGGRIGKPGSLGEQQLHDLVDSGMSIGTHGMDHRPWRGLAGHDRKRELVDARHRLAELLRQPIDEAALPLGRYDRRTLRDLRSLGYHRVHTSDRRWSRREDWLQPRFSARAGDAIESWRTEVLTPARPIERAKLEAIGLVKSLR